MVFESPGSMRTMKMQHYLAVLAHAEWMLGAAAEQQGGRSDPAARAWQGQHPALHSQLALQLTQHALCPAPLMLPKLQTSQEEAKKQEKVSCKLLDN